MSVITQSALTPAESVRSLATWQHSALRVGERTDFPRDKSLHQVFEETAAEYPERIALEFGSDSLTYKELNVRANRLANRMLLNGVQPGQIVGLYAGRSIETIIGILGILKAGATYLPLDPRYPESRIERAVSMAQPGHILVNRDISRWPPGLHGRRVMDLRVRSSYSADTRNPDQQIDPATHPFYLIFTSGTTGQPKGVRLTHLNMLNLVYHNWRDGGMSFSRKVLNWAPLGFDASANEIFSCLLAGGTLVLIDDRKRLIVSDFLKVLGDHEVETVLLSAAYLRKIFSKQNWISEIPPCVRYWQSTGQRLQLTPPMRAFFSSGPIIFNEYGPSETHVSNSVAIDPIHTFTDSPEIGHPVANSFIVLVDNGALVDPGKKGEIYIGGECVGPGYFQNPDLTSQKFGTIELNGQLHRIYRTGDFGRWTPNGLEFVGRRADQFKSNGNLVLLSDVEAALQKVSSIAESKVLITGEDSCVAFVKPKTDTMTGAEIREAMDIDDYALPKKIYFVSDFPTNANDKTDYDKLKKLGVSESEKRKPASAMSDREREVADILSAVLGIDNIGPNDTFAGLGGDSMGFMDVTLAFVEQFQASLDPNINQTVAAMADVADGKTGTTTDHADLEDEARLEVPALPVAVAPDRDAILLTGASGYFGAFLLHALGDIGRGTTIYCVVRADSDSKAEEKIERQLEKFSLNNPELREQIVAVPGDLTQPQLGFDPEVYEQIRQRVHAIYHVAAEVNVLASYDQLKASNVEGTRNIIHLARQAGNAAIHYASSTSAAEVLSTALPLIPEQTVADLPRAHARSSGYAKTKWTAERMLGHARSAGIPVSIYRLPRLVPTLMDCTRADSVAWNYDDAFLCFLKSCVQIGCMPDIQINDYWMPVDSAARAFAMLGTAQQQDIFHLTLAEPITSQVVRETLGIHLPVEQLGTWLNLAGQASDASEACHTVDRLREHAFVELNGRRFSATNSRRMLTDLHFEFPPAPHVLLQQTFERLRKHDPSCDRFTATWSRGS